MFVFGIVGVVVAGAALGLVGGGGSLLLVPALVYLFRLPPNDATAYSLIVVAVSSAAGAYLHHRHRPIRFAALLWFGAPSAVAAWIVRVAVVPLLPGDFVVSAFAVFAGVAGVAMLRRGRFETRRAGPRGLVPIVGALAGAVTGLVGTGGGFLLVPALVLLVGLPFRDAIGASLAVIAAQTVAGSLGALTTTTLDAGFAALLSALMVSGIVAGIYAGRGMPPERLKRGLAWLLLAITGVMACAGLS